MATRVVDDPLSIRCVFSDGSRAEFDLAELPNPRLARDLAVGLVELIHPHGSADSAGTVNAYAGALRAMVRALAEWGFAGGAGVDRTAFYGDRPYAHLRTEFEERLQQLHQTGQTPDPRTAQIPRLKAEIDHLKQRISQADQKTAELTDFRGQAVARLAAQHDEIVRLREVAAGTSHVIRLPTNRSKLIGPC
ncbi:hypothetical protein Asp14428_33410 [Actinoplanes sp. NBRC 14428]|nr:hypothetical protein Asp14428_33410 [Actinoplanes sp. NBRC 14428]